MPMKMVPMNPAMKNNISGSVNATAVLSCRSRSVSARRRCARVPRRGGRFPRRRRSFPEWSWGKSPCFCPGWGPRASPFFTPSMESAMVSVSIWLPMALLATVRALMSETPGAEQRAEHAAEARHGIARDEAADHRDLQASPFRGRAALVGDRASSSEA